MSKTIAEILTPKPEARPRLYANDIADNAHAGLRAKGAAYASPGQRPGLTRRPHQALKGRPNRHRHWVALSGLEWITAIEPRALPWAGIGRPLGTIYDRIEFGGTGR